MNELALVAVGLFILAVAAVYTVYQRDRRRAIQRLRGQSQTVETSFGTLEFAVSGNGDPVLVVHGASGGFDQGLEMAGLLSERGFRLIAPSRFGYLGSAMPVAPTPAMQADAYAELLDQQKIDRTVVMGISAGAWSSLQFAVRHPERCRALILLVPANYLPEGTSLHGGPIAKAFFNSEFAAWVILRLLPILPNKITAPLLGTDAAVLRTADPAEKARVRRLLKHLLPIHERLAGMNFDVKIAATREQYAIEKISCPVLTISAQDDHFGTHIRAEEIAQAVPHGNSLIFPTGGHTLTSRQQQALEAIAEFLGRLAKNSGSF